MNIEVEETMKNCPTCLDFQATQPKDETVSHEIPGKPWVSVGADIFMINKKHYFHTVDSQWSNK